ncbi:hypothetical protein SKAU_G00300780 [Synaphobranchus kaupii]|uniref:Uncharacterized protein n=1 Tax=Synaphobranchus kaupii TaxID=118154 RepID=A0A9Q1EVL9_SYNKA|nr:hypothetical protein SKAU_G00300780 [Synaphobranchus kaupii]
MACRGLRELGRLGCTADRTRLQGRGPEEALTRNCGGSGRQAISGTPGTDDSCGSWRQAEPGRQAAFNNNAGERSRARAALELRWARAHQTLTRLLNNLAMALSNQGLRLGGADGPQRLVYTSTPRD